VIEHYCTWLEEDRDSIAASIRVAIPAETSAYANLPPARAETWASGVDAALGMFIDGGILGRDLGTDERAAMRRIGRERAEQGIPVDSVAASIAVAARVVRDWPLRRLRGPLSAEDRDALALLSERATTFANKLTSEALTAHLERREEQATSLEHARARLWTDLLGGTVSEDDGERRGEALGCDLGTPWTLLLSMLGQDEDSTAFEEAVFAAVPGSVVVPLATAATPHIVVAAPTERFNSPGEVRRLLTALAAENKATVVGVGPVSGARRLFGRYRTGRNLLPYLDRLTKGPALFVEAGEHTEAALLAAVPEDERVAYVDDVLGEIERAPSRWRVKLLRTLEAVVEHDGSPKAAAAALGVSVKTVRRHIEQIQELIGRDLGRLVDLQQIRTALILRRMSTRWTFQW
jgi:sugar diacid utilization regulator